MNSLNKRRAVLLSLLAGGLLAIWILYSFLSVLFSPNMDRYVESLRGQGLRTEPRDFVREVPDDRNAAALWEDHASSLTFRLKGSHEEFRPTVIVNRLMSGMEVPEEKRDLLIRLYKENTGVFETLRRIGDCPDYGARPGDLSVSHRDLMSRFQKKVSIYYRVPFSIAIELARRGRQREAVDLWRLTVRSSRHWVEHPFLVVDYLEGVNARLPILPAAKKVFRGTEFDPNLLKRIARELEPSDVHRQAVETCDLVRTMFLQEMLSILAGEAIRRKRLLPDWLQYPGAGILARPFIRRDIVETQKHFLLLEKVLAGPSHERLGACSRKPFLGYTEDLPKWQFVSWALLHNDAYLTLIDRGLMDTSRMEVLRLALAIKAYRIEQGEWPETLDGLAPDYIESVPLDPYTGKTMIFRQRGDGFVVYSVGANGTDDGGNPTHGDDVVWEERASLSSEP
ncbi:hypothetical protein JW916_00350 [Candidatus Sumerlaeota bacterium]|nr:hypothetical protein [Candidatus Sumerlaeota bacterium]